MTSLCDLTYINYAENGVNLQKSTINGVSLSLYINHLLLYFFVIHREALPVVEIKFNSVIRSYGRG